MPLVCRGGGGLQRARRSASTRVDFSAVQPSPVDADDGQRRSRDVDLDQVALLDQRDRAAVQRLGRHVADRRAFRRAGEAAVGDDRRGGCQRRVRRR